MNELPALSFLAASGLQILDVYQVALLLRCSVDQARRVPRSDLPVYRGPGRARLYLADDLMRFVRSRRITGRDVDALVREISGELESRSDSVRRRSRNGE